MIRVSPDALAGNFSQAAAVAAIYAQLTPYLAAWHLLDTTTRAGRISGMLSNGELSAFVTDLATMFHLHVEALIEQITARGVSTSPTAIRRRFRDQQGSNLPMAALSYDVMTGLYGMSVQFFMGLGVRITFPILPEGQTEILTTLRGLDDHLTDIVSAISGS